jgi:hypothetical protein
MANTKSSRNSAKISSLQEAVETGLAALPRAFLEKQISKKLKEQITAPPEGLARKMAEHLLSGSNKPFCADGIGDDVDVHITIDESDLKEVEAGVLRFQKENLPELLRSMSEDAAKRTLRSLKTRWPDEQNMQESDLAGFHERMQNRWEKPLGQLRMLLTMVREWCGEVHVREEGRTKAAGHKTRKLLIRMLVRACQVADEVLCLLENGFADGAMARWRTLHEIAVVAAVISQHGDEITERYIEHQYVESKRAMEKYNASSLDLGFRQLSARDQKRIVREYDRVIAAYGKSFKSDYGWAGFHLRKNQPTFVDLEAAAGRAEMRSYYQMGNDNIHAGIKSMYVRLGLVGSFDGLLSGRSNAGLTDPGQNTAHTLTQLAVLVCGFQPLFDDNVISLMLCELRDEIPRSFSRVDARIKAEERAIKLKRRKQRSKGNS